MSTTTETKAAVEKATPKTPATKAAPKKAAPKEAKVYTASATGRGGKVNVRKVPIAAKFAVDVADPKDGKTPAAKAGLIFRFYADQATAEEFAAKKRAEGLDAIVVAATSKEA